MDGQLHTWSYPAWPYPAQRQGLIPTEADLRMYTLELDTLRTDVHQMTLIMIMIALAHTHTHTHT